MQTRAIWYPTGCLLADLVVTLDDFSAARLVPFWLLVPGLKAYFPMESMTAASNEGLVVCAYVADLWLDKCPCRGACIQQSM